MENIFVEFLPPWVETGLQPAFYDKESGTVLQQTARMYARVNMLIRMFNKLSKNTKTTVEDYINQFNELHDYVHDYFDNLDVQEEINNKLDAMVEDGTLQEIVADYLNSKAVFGFDTVADMKLATNLIDGSYARTLGYYAKNDGGGAYYKISSTQPSSHYVTLSNNLYAEMIIDKKIIHARQFGCYGDNVHDDTASLQSAINAAATIGTLILDPGVYKITDTLTLPNAFAILGSGDLHGSTGENTYIGSEINQTTANTDVFALTANTSYYGMIMKSFRVSGNGGCGLNLTSPEFSEFTFEEIKFNDTLSPAIYGDFLDIGTIDNCYFGTNNGAIHLKSANNVFINKCNFWNNSDYSIKLGTTRNIVISECYFENTAQYAYPQILMQAPCNIAELVIQNCSLYDVACESIRCDLVTNITQLFVLDHSTISNCIFTNSQNDCCIYYNNLLNGSRNSNGGTHTSNIQFHNCIFEKMSDYAIKLNYKYIYWILRDCICSKPYTPSDVANMVSYYNTDSYGIDTNSGYLLSPTNGEVVKANKIYMDSNYLPKWYGNDNKAQNICTMRSGTTSNRPTTLLYVGCVYFDITLGKPIWYNGSNWVDSTGNRV